MQNAILKHMSAKKIIFVFFAFTFFISGNAFAANPVVVVFTDPPNCGPCRDYDPLVNRLVREGYPIMIVNLTDLQKRDSRTGRLVIPADDGRRAFLAAIYRSAKGFNSIPLTSVFDVDNNGMPLKEIERKLGEVSSDGLIGDGSAGPVGLLTKYGVTPQPAQEPELPLTVPAPKPRNASDIVPDPVDIPSAPQVAPKPEIITFKPTKFDKAGGAIEYAATQADGSVVYVRKGMKKFAAIDAQYKKDPTTQYILTITKGPIEGKYDVYTFSDPLPKIERESELSDTLPLVPGDPGYESPSKPPKVTPASVSDSGELPCPTPKDDKKAPLVANNGANSFIVTFSDKTQYEYKLQDPVFEDGEWVVRWSRCQLKATNCSPVVAIKNIKDKPFSTAAEAKASAEELLRDGLLTPRPLIIPPMPPIKPKYSYTLSEPVLRPDGKYGVYVTVKGGVKPLEFYYGVGNVKDAQAATDIMNKRLQGGVLLPEYFPKPPAPVKPPQYKPTFSDKDFKDPIFESPKPKPPVTGTPLTPAQAAEYVRKLAEIKAEQEAIKEQIDALPKSRP